MLVNLKFTFCFFF